MENSTVTYQGGVLDAVSKKTQANSMLSFDFSSIEYTYKLFKSAQDLPADWDAIAPNDFFLQKHYLESLERTPPIGMRFGYLLFYGNGEPVGLSPLQIRFFKADENIGEFSEPANKTESGVKCFFTAFSSYVKRKVASKVAADVLIVGNMLLSGEHGFYFDPTKINVLKAMELLEKACVESLSVFKKDSVRMPVIFIKDVLPTRANVRDFMEKKDFARFEIQPNMSLDLPFTDFDDYLASMSTKYRTRVKRAFKKIEGVERREMNVDEIKANNDLIYSLYHDIASNAVFNMVDLHPDYFWRMKEELPEWYRLYGYFENGALIGYNTTIRNGNELEAHFLGYNKELNHEKQIYQNMLLDLVKAAFEEGCSTLQLGRTALEIKSTIGATPQSMDCYLRYQNALANRFTGTMLDYLNPVETWTQRRPFKNQSDQIED